MLEGISHLTFIVHDLEKGAMFFKEIFQAEEFYDSGQDTFSLSAEKYLSINGLWICIMKGEPLSERTYNHTAFQVAPGKLPEYEKRINELGLELRPSRPRLPEEGLSLYFYDYDNHLFELHEGSLEVRLLRYRQGR